MKIQRNVPLSVRICAGLALWCFPVTDGPGPLHLGLGHVFTGIVPVIPVGVMLPHVVLDQVLRPLLCFLCQVWVQF